MTRLNLMLYAVLMMTALLTVKAQHQARSLYIDLQRGQLVAKKYDEEFSQLQLEQSSWAMHSRVERIATEQLNMQIPNAQQTQVITSKP